MLMLCAMMVLSGAITWGFTVFVVYANIEIMQWAAQMLPGVEPLVEVASSPGFMRWSAVAMAIASMGVACFIDHDPVTLKMEFTSPWEKEMRLRGIFPGHAGVFKMFDSVMLGICDLFF